jgi:hypothetical protein
MTTLESAGDPFEGRKRYKEGVDVVPDFEPSTYFDASLKGEIDYFEAYVKKYPPSDPENLSRLEGIEGALFYEYGDEGKMYMNEVVYIIMIIHGYQFSNDLFALLVCGSIYILIGTEIHNYDSKLKDCIEKYQKLEITINGQSELMTQMKSFIHYMYDTESYNQEPLQDALLGVSFSIRSFTTTDDEPLFPNFNYNI